MAKQVGKYKETISQVRLRGIINGLSNPMKNFGYSEGVTQNKRPYRSIRFRVKTSPKNNVAVECFGTTKDNAYFYNKSTKHTQAVPWNERLHTVMDGYDSIEEPYDLCERINREFKDGDSVFIFGSIQFDSYQATDGTTQLSRKFIIKSISPTTEPINFDAANFTEMSEFVQEIVVSNIQTVRDNLQVHGYAIGYKDKLSPAELIVKQNEVPQPFWATFKKQKPGTRIQLNGNVNSRIATYVDDAWGKQVANGRAENSLTILGASAESVIPNYMSVNDMTALLQQQNQSKPSEPTFDAPRVAAATTPTDLPFAL